MLKNKMLQEEPQQRSLGDKALSAGYKIGGWDLRLKAIGLFIGAAIFFVVAIYFLISSFGSGGSAFLFFFVLFLVISIVNLLIGLYNWKRAKSLVKGRYY